ncbi:nucleotidyltransferase, partial [Elizabethkingia meningoseptica]|nr:nucleotidyltransferase [Elizabethkingia meningoseptica]
ENRNELLDIKTGNWSYDAIMQKAEELINAIESYYTTSALPDYPDIEKTTKLLVAIREKLYR